LSYQILPLRRFVCGLIIALLALSSLQAQSKPQTNQEPIELEYAPLYATARIFQARAKKGGNQDLTDQLFKLPTAQLGEYEKWMICFKKTYPDFKLELLQAHQLRVAKSRRPTIIAFGNSNTRRSLEFRLSAAHSPGDGVKAGVSLIQEVELHFGNDRLSKPVSLAIHPVEAEDGITYFFTNQNMTLDPQSYVNFLRPGASAKAFEAESIFFVLAVSVSFKKPVETARVLDEKESAELQAKATKKPQPTLPEEIRQRGLSGTVQVSVEVAPDGRVARADIIKSSLPEATYEVLAAARQWEFPLSIFAESKQPVKGVLTFNFTSPGEKPASSSGEPNSTKPKDGSK
jgi:TonB family protein